MDSSHHHLGSDFRGTCFRLELYGLVKWRVHRPSSCLLPSYSAGPAHRQALPRSALSPTAPEAARQLDACSLLPEALVGTKLRGAVTNIRRLTRADFISPPPGAFAACAYETNSDYGQLIVWVQPMDRREYEIRYVERATVNTRKVANVGEDARLDGCGGLTVYSKGRILQLGIQYGGRACGSLKRVLPSLARFALRRL
jgi:hypothetical protein